jgi:hypothetical protein
MTSRKFGIMAALIVAAPALVVGGSATWDEQGYIKVDTRAAWNYAATGNSSAMMQKTVGSGSQCLMATRDASGAFLNGGKSYRFHLPPKVPTEVFFDRTWKPDDVVEMN